MWWQFSPLRITVTAAETKRPLWNWTMHWNTPSFNLIPHPVVVNLMLQDALRITSYKKNRWKRKNKEGRKKKTPQKMNSSLRKIINNFRAFLPTTLSQKMKVKKNLKKNIKQKKEEPCNSKNKKCFFGRIWLTYEKHSDPKSIISFGKAAISNGYIYIQKFSCVWILEIVLWFWTNIWPFYSTFNLIFLK